MSKTTVQTKQGPITVTRRVNSAGKITARHDGKTYIGESWKEVETKIKEMCSIEVELAKYIRIDTKNWDRYDRDGFSARVSSSIVKASQFVEGRGFLVSCRSQSERWVEAENLEEALGIETDEGEVLILWTKEREKAIRSLFAEMEDHSKAFARFVGLGPKRVGDHLDKGVTLAQAIALGQKKKRSKKKRSR